MEKEIIIEEEKKQETTPCAKDYIFAFCETLAILIFGTLFFAVPSYFICGCVTEYKEMTNLENEKAFCRTVYLDKDKILKECKKYISEEND